MRETKRVGIIRVRERRGGQAGARAFVFLCMLDNRLECFEILPVCMFGSEVDVFICILQAIVYYTHFAYIMRSIAKGENDGTSARNQFRRIPRMH